MFGLGVMGAPAQADRAALAATPRTTEFVDINPDNEGPLAGQPGLGLAPCPDPCASQHNGGRVNGVATVPGVPGSVPTTYFGASEVGGLFKSVDGAASWKHLDGHIPNLTWDVAARPDGLHVFATSFYDGRSVPLTGVQQSTDGGATWTRPNLPDPAGCATGRAAQPSGFGLGLRPGTTEAFAGTNCGLARSLDNGSTWTRFDPTPGDGTANSVWDVVALPGGRTYACGDDGLVVSMTGAPGTWQSLGKPNPALGGYCSLAVSPDDPTIVFVASGFSYFADIVVSLGGADFFEGRIDESGAVPTIAWTQFPYPDDPTAGMVKKLRIPFLETNDRSAGFDPADPSDGFDLWVGDGSLWRIPCHAGQTPQCTTDSTKWAGSFSDHLGGSQAAHGDSGDLVFDPLAGVDACPTLYSNDGGVAINASTTGPGCQTPDWRGSNVGLHAFYLRGMTGFAPTGGDPVDDEDLYIALQDAGLFSTSNGGAATPIWTHGIGGDVFDVATDGPEVFTSAFGLQVGDRGFTNMTFVAGSNTMPSQPLWDSEALVTVGPGRYFLAVYAPFTFNGTNIPRGIRDITNATTAPLGTAFGGAAWPAAADAPCHVAVAEGASGPVPYVLAGRCWYGTRSIPFGTASGAADQLWTFQGSAWVQRFPGPSTPGGTVAPGAGFSTIAVDPTDPLHLYASVLYDGPPRMMRSTDGGVSWTTDERLTTLMNDGFAPNVANPGDGIRVMPQPSLIAFDPFDPRIVVAGGRQAGIFLSSDGGATWATLTDPFTPSTSGIPHLPAPAYAHFDHDRPGVVRIYLGTGRGIWRVDLETAYLAVTSVATPDPAPAGADLSSTLQVTNTGPDMAQNATLEDDLPAGTTFQSLTAPTGWSCSTPAVGSTGSVACRNPSMAPGTATFTLVVRVDAATPAGTTLANEARVFAAAVDPNPADNEVTTSTAVIRVADLAIVSQTLIDPPSRALIGAPASVSLRKVVTNHGPSAPVDTAIAVTTTAPQGSTVSPPSVGLTEPAIGLEEHRTILESFAVTCGAPGSQTFAFANAISPEDGTTTDPNPANDTKTTSLSVDCVVPVAINIRPHGSPNAINLRSQATLAVLTTGAGEYGLPLAFDATTIDPASVRFGPADVVFAGLGGAAEVHHKGHSTDSYELDEKTRDGDFDLVLHFRADESGLTKTSTEGCVAGTFAGPGGATLGFFGCDTVVVRP